MHGDPLAFLALPEQAFSFAFDSVDLWSVRFSCGSAVLWLCPVLRSDIIGGTSNLLHTRTHARI